MQIRGETLRRHTLASNLREQRKATPGPQPGSLIISPTSSLPPLLLTWAPVTRGSRLAGERAGAAEVLIVRRVSGFSGATLFFFLFLSLHPFPISTHTHPHRLTMKGWGLMKAKLPASSVFLITDPKLSPHDPPRTDF